MNCSRFETLLTDYMDESLDHRVREALEQHLSGCPNCSRLLADISKLQEMLVDFPQVEPSPDFVERVLEQTCGKIKVRSLLADFVLPTVRAFATQRFVFATLIMFVFLSLVANLAGPDFSALSFSDFRPSALAEQADRVSGQVYKKWMQVRNAEQRMVGEMWRLKEDLYGRLDSHLIKMLVKSYQESIKDKSTNKKEEGQKK